MIRIQHTVAAAFGFAFLASHGAAAQRGGFPEVRTGQLVHESLDSASSRYIDGRPFRVFQFQAQPGRRYVATMESPAFDPYLILARTNGGITESLKEDDDGGDGTSARLRFTVQSPGTYLLIARGYAPSASGRFTVGLEDAGEIVVPAPVPVRVGETTEGSLSDTDGFLDEGDKNYDLYVVRGDPGEDVHVVLASSAFDAFLEVGELVDGRFQSEQSNDDYQGRDAGLQMRLGRRGEAVVRATSLGGGQVGAYTLTVRTGKLPPAGAEGVVADVPIAAPVPDR